MTSTYAPKRKVAELAIFGGARLFSDSVVVGAPNIPDIDSAIDEIRKVLSSGILSNDGPFLRRFEDQVKQLTDARHCIATCNATAALQLTARALGVSGEVIVPSFTFIATAHALSWQGLTPVFADVDPATHTIDPSDVEKSITLSTRGICGVHLWGNVCDVHALKRIADEHHLPLWFDASHALLASHAGTSVGNFGDAEVFSFHATKFINAFEGGAVVTNNDELAQTLREMRNFGLSESHHDVMQYGINAKLPEPSAAMGLVSLSYLDQIQSTNRKNFHCYRDLLTDCPGIRIGAPAFPDLSNCQYIVIEIEEDEVGLSRDQLLSILRAEGIVAQRYFYPGCHAAGPYRQNHVARDHPLPVTARLTQSVLVLPTGLRVSPKAIEKVCALIWFLAERSGDVRREFRHRIPQAAPG